MIQIFKIQDLEGPIFQHFYLANQLQCLIKWIHATYHHHPWLDIEQTGCQDIAIADLPFLSDQTPQLFQKHRNRLNSDSLVRK